MDWSRLHIPQATKAEADAALQRHARACARRVVAHFDGNLPRSITRGEAESVAVATRTTARLVERVIAGEVRP